jgi:ABC-2 type transport system ATP-binding protein
MVDTQSNRHRTAPGEDPLGSVQPGADPWGKRNGEPSLVLRRQKRLRQRLQGVPQIGSSAGQGTPVPLGAGQPLAPSPAAIMISNLCKTFGSKKGRVQAVDQLSLVVQQGEIFGLLGPNGSRKTTTINLLSGLSVPTSGEVRVMGYEVRRHGREVRQLLGTVPQETALYEELSAWQNMEFHADLFGIPRKEKRQRITGMLELVGLLDRKDSRVGTFSGGMKRRLALARALLHEPQLLYLDEPTLGVDVQSRRAIWDYILTQRQRGRTVLLTTNYLEEAQALCDRIAIIDHGKLIAVDTPAHLKQACGGRVIEVETARPSQEVDRLWALAGVKAVKQDGTRLAITTEGVHTIAPQIITILSQAGEITGIAIREPNLDEVFLKLTGTALRD